ncbi:hypothetical protein Xaut_3441 [Xanthobacter versatilis]|uniref:Uncharacterized protein n=1 Tax=Xanthobacter autotrophicus (strain ATCC BAA-1158 / Py2) TaxID=78245 RepID=A7IKX7_XANP2|nr:hypothetical protein Xaut_3441 [Xanthobacter autotrophicus Py2]
MIPVLHEALCNGQRLRLFRPPADGTDFPWHAMDDLHACLGLPAELRRTIMRGIRSQVIVHTVATADGIVTIAPHFMAYGLIEGAIERGHAPAWAEKEYRLSMVVAMKKMTAHLGEAGSLGFAIAAARRQADDDGGAA